MVCKISVIIPCFNVEPYVAECLDSVLRQEFDDMEILCVDDGSTDGTHRILNQYEERDERIHIVSYGKNGGLSYARNRAMEQAQGEYIFFLDSDDQMMEGSLPVLYQQAFSQSLDVLAFDAKNIYEDGLDANALPPIGRRHGSYDGIMTGQEFFCHQMKQNDLLLMAWGALWRTSFLRDRNIWFREGILHEDNPFSFHALMLAKRAAYLARDCYVYRRRKSSITTQGVSKKRLEGMLAGLEDSVAVYDGLQASERESCFEGVQGYVRMMESQVSSMLEDYHRTSSEPIRLSRLSWTLECRALFPRGFRFLHGWWTESTLARLKNAELVIIYGAGKIGIEVLHLLETYGVRHYALAVTKHSEEQPYGLSGMARELHEYRSFCATAYVIVATGKKLHTKMEEEARRQGFQHIVWYEELK